MGPICGHQKGRPTALKPASGKWPSFLALTHSSYLYRQLGHVHHKLLQLYNAHSQMAKSTASLKVMKNHSSWLPHSLKEDARASQLGARPSKAVAGLSRSYSPNLQRFCPPAKKVAPNRASASNLAARRQPCVREERCHNPKEQVRKGFLALTRPIACRRTVAQMTLRRAFAAY